MSRHGADEAGAALFLYDDERARLFEPFALTRPVAELRSGALLTRQRWEAVAGVRASGLICAQHLADFEEADAPPAAQGELPAGAVVANARCTIDLTTPLGDATVWTCRGRVAAVRLARETPASVFAGGGLALETLAPEGAATRAMEGRWLDEVWDLVRLLPEQLASDIARLGPRLETEEPAQAIRLGGHALYVERGATVEPMVCFDLGDGPILVRRGATVRAFTRLVGPCAIGEGSIVAGDRIAASSIGEHCRVHGEMSTTVVLAYANKAHDGFVGHSYLGRWSNLGAGTTTSNLKNTYGPVALWTPSGVRDTGMQFLGSLVGDHARTGIGMRLTTGTVVGAGANIFGAHMPPKAVPPFAWGDVAPYGTYALDKFLVVAERAMGRRHVALGERGRRHLAAVHGRRWMVA
jgi:UDP-N-acetylglucosamine diphosphorylase/glucosamine-1-phosphate N-acetyltransferase